MKAISYYQYGSIDNLHLEEIPKPVPRDNEVLIKVYTVSLNSWDYDMVMGKPYIVRMISGGLSKPKLTILGCDVAGVIEKVGAKVSQFKEGDAVLGDLSECGWGGFAEFVCAEEKFLTTKPDNMPFEDAAAIPQAAGLAIGGIKYVKEIKPRDKVLINGSGGGVGTFGIQMAKALDAEVTGVDTSEKFEVMKAAGADHVIDYKKEDFTKNGQLYDRILDVVANRSLFDYARSLKAGGVFGMIGGKMGRIFQTALLGSWIVKGKKLGLVAWRPSGEAVKELVDLYQKGIIKPIIGKTYPLEKTPQAIKDLADGKVLGKAVIIVNN